MCELLHLLLAPSLSLLELILENQCLIERLLEAVRLLNLARNLSSLLFAESRGQIIVYRSFIYCALLVAVLGITVNNFEKLRIRGVPTVALIS